MKQSVGYVLKKINGISYVLPYGQNIADHKYAVRLNETGELLWDIMKNDVSRSDIYEALFSDIEDELSADEKSQIEKDIDIFLDRLLRTGVVRENRERQKMSAWKSLCIGGLVIRLEGHPDVFSKDFENFVTEKTEETDADMVIRVNLFSTPVHDNGYILLRNEDICIFEHEDEYIVLFPKMEQVKQAVIKKDGSYAEYFCVPPCDETLKNDLFHAMRTAYLYRAQQAGIYAIHSASILYNDKAWLFTGPSGTGKSTHTNLWKDNLGVPVINGDLNLITIEDGEAVVYGLPWCGTSGIAKNDRYVLGGVVLLEQYRDNIVEELTMERKIVGIMNRLISPSWTEKLMTENLVFSEKIADIIYTGRLKCTKEIQAMNVMKTRIDTL